MLTQEDLLIAIQADTKDAAKSIGDLKGQLIDMTKALKSTQQASESTADALTDIGAIAVKLKSAVDIAVQAWDMMAGTIGHALEEADKASTAFDKLSITLKTFGDTSAQKSAQGIADYADELESLTGANSEALQGLVAQAAAAGLTSDKYKTLMKAAVGLSTQTGSLEGAGQSLLMTLKGVTRGVDVYDQSLKGMSPVSARAGDAIVSIANNLGSLGEAFGKTAEGINARYKAALGNVFEELGKLLNETFNILGAKESKIKFFESLIEKIKDVRVNVIAFRDTLLQMDWEAIAIGVGTITSAFLLLNGTVGNVIGNLLRLGATFATAAAPVLVYGVTIAGIASAIELVARNMEHLGELGNLVFWQLTRGILKVRIAFNEWSGDDSEAKALKMRLEGITQETEKLKGALDFGVSGRIFETLNSFAEKFKNNQQQAAIATKETSKALDSTAQGAKRVAQLSEEALQKQKELFDLLAQLESASKVTNDVQKLELKAQADKLSLKNKIEEYSKVVAISQVEKDRLYNMGSMNIETAKLNEIHAKQKDILDSINEKNAELQMQIDEAGKSKNEILDIEYRNQERLINQMIDKYKLEGISNKEIEESLKRQIELRGKALPGQKENGAQQGLSAINKGISYLGWVGQLLAAIPELGKAAQSIITSITNLPDIIVKIVNSIQHAAEGFMKNFGSGLVDAIGNLLDGFVQHTENLSQAAIEGVYKIIQRIPKLFDKLPDLLRRFITTAFRDAGKSIGPVIKIAFVEATKLAFSSTEMIVGLIEAIVEGIGDGLSGLFSGDFFDWDFGSKGEDLGDGFAKSIKKLSGSGDRLFNVSEIVQSASKDAQNIVDKVKAETKNISGNLWKAIVEAFKNFGTMVVDLTEKAFRQAPVETWKFIKNFAKAMADTLSAALNTLANPFSADFFLSAEQREEIKKALANAFDAAWNLFLSHWEETGNFLKAAGLGLDKTLFQPMKEGFIKLGLWLDENIWQPIGGSLVGYIKDTFGNVKSFFKGLFTFDGGGKGAVENFLGFDFPWLSFSQGGVVPGIPKLKGDSATNDTVPALLSPGEVVIPRSMLQDPAFARVLDAKFKGKNVEGHFDGWRVAKGILSGGASEILGNQVVTPEWAMDLYNSLKRFASDVNLSSLITNPNTEITRAIKNSLGNFKGYFQKMMHFGDGGFVPGVGSRDTVPAMLTPGEFVMNRRMVNNLMNGGSQNSGNYTFNISLDIENKDPMDETYVRNKLIPKIKDEIRRASLDGQFIIAQKGVRTT